MLIKGAPHKRLWPDRYNGVGGHIERGEDILSAARRELREETGLSCPALRLCGTVTVDTGEDVGIGIYVFQGDCPSGEVVASPEGELEWVEFNQVQTLDLVEDLYTLLPKVLNLDLESAPFSAHYSYDSLDRLEISFANP